MTTLMDYAKANIRTIVPYVVGLVVTLAARHGIKLDAQETAALSVILGAIYYALVHALERYVTPKFGWLLGLAQQPVYATSKRRTTGVPATLTDEQNRRSGPAYKVGSAHARLHLLPKPSGRKGGALPSPRDDRDYQAKLPAKIPASIDNGAGISWGMLLNDRIGDCYPVALLHALQVLTGYTPVDADALAIYEQVTGYDPTKSRPDGTNPTDNGTAGRPLFDWGRKQGLIDSYAAIPPNRQAVRAAIAGHKVALCEWALPAGAETEGDVWTMPRKGRAAGSWGGHATVEAGYTRSRNRNVTWGEYGTVTPSFEDAYLQAGWTISTSLTASQVAAIMAKVRTA